MEEEFKMIIDAAKQDMDKSISHLERELLNIRAGKANPMMLSGVQVDYYGTMTPLSQISNVNTPDARTLSVQPWEKNMLQPCEKAIQEANLGLNPMNNGETLMINIPPLTEERRKELVKQSKTEAENAKISIRNARQDGNKEIKKIEASEDLKSNQEQTIQDLTNTYIKKIEDIIAAKEREIMTV